VRQRRLRVAWLTALALLVALALPQLALGQGDGQAGTTLSASKTAEGYWIREYDWTVEKSADQEEVTIPTGQSVTVTFTITATRGEPRDIYGVRGEICVTNGGDRATQELQIVDVVQYKPGSGQFQELTRETVDTNDNPVLDRGESHCYPYDVEFVPVLGAIYRNEARVTITNHSGWLGTPFGPAPKAGFSLPSTPTDVRDETATLSDALTCPVGFSCTLSTAGPWNLSGSHQVTLGVTVTNLSACDTTQELVNTATLTEDDTGTPHTARATVRLVAPRCETEPGGELEGCTRTQGYWKNHPDDWPASYSPDDRFFSSGQTWMQVLQTPPARGNAYYILAHQYIAAVLNQAANSGATLPDAVEEALAWAETFFSTYRPGDTLSRDVRAQAIWYAGLLDGFNNGEFEGWPHCDD
jgi:hypothetical protein